MRKALVAAVAAGALGALLWQHGILKPAPPPPPAPPPILLEPAPVLGEAELQRVLKSASDPEPSVRWEAVVFLDKVKSPRAMPIMRDMLRRDPDPQVRIHILALLGNRSGADVVETVIGALSDPEAEVRVAALDALDKIGDYSAARTVADAPIRDSDDRVRLKAVRTLNDLQDRKQKEIDEARARYEEEKRAAAQNK